MSKPENWQQMSAADKKKWSDAEYARQKKAEDGKEASKASADEIDPEWDGINLPGLAKPGTPPAKGGSTPKAVENAETEITPLEVSEEASIAIRAMAKASAEASAYLRLLGLPRTGKLASALEENSAHVAKHFKATGGG